MGRRKTPYNLKFEILNTYTILFDTNKKLK